MSRHLLFRIVWASVNLSLVAAVVMFAYGAGWEYSTRRYLKGFADAVVPLSASPEQQVKSILAWMRSGPAQDTSGSAESLPRRDPEITLNFSQLLNVCGTATNAFVNLASSAGLPSRRLLLLDERRQSKHVVAEVEIEGRWVVVDPAFRFIFRDASGRMLTHHELQDINVLREATQRVPGYPSEYTFDNTAHVRLSRIPYIGHSLRKILNRILPGWEEAVNWTMVVERESFAVMLVGLVLGSFLLACRLFLGWFGDRRLGIQRVRLREQLRRAGQALLTTSR